VTPVSARRNKPSGAALCPPTLFTIQHRPAPSLDAQRLLPISTQHQDNSDND
jgi:hypothetical protein